MDYKISIGEYNFVRDEDKNQLNIERHGIKFKEAATVFSDSAAKVDYDDDHSKYEDRFSIIGRSDAGNLLMVIHCIREGGVIRLISAGKAEKKEEKRYYSNEF